MYKIVKTPDALNSFVEGFKDPFTKPVGSSLIRRLYWILVFPFEYRMLKNLRNVDTMIGITLRGKALSFCCGRLREVVLQKTVYIRPCLIIRM